MASFHVLYTGKTRKSTRQQLENGDRVWATFAIYIASQRGKKGAGFAGVQRARTPPPRRVAVECDGEKVA